MSCDTETERKHGENDESDEGDEADKGELEADDD